MKALEIIAAGLILLAIAAGLCLIGKVLGDLGVTVSQ